MVNDGLMAVFFFLVGLEIKRELLHGELASFRKAALPAVAAVGGMAMPALIFLLFNRSSEGAAGWGIPMATDIAFALGALALLGRRVPAELRVFLLGLAVVDDLGAIAVIALFYTETIYWADLGLGIAMLVLIAACIRIGIRSLGFYLVLSFVMWQFFLESRSSCHSGWSPAGGHYTVRAGSPTQGLRRCRRRTASRLQRSYGER